jgi:acetyl esterase/lipase
MKSALLCFLIVFGAAMDALAIESAAPVKVKLWPGDPVGEVGDAVGEEKATTEQRGKKTVVAQLTNISIPELYIYPAPRENATQAAMLILPGGGYTHLDWEDEGEQTAAWLNSIGVTAAILKYRVPQREGTPLDVAPPMALMDAQRAMSILRSRAGEWGVAADRIGVIGFSAGGHLAAWLSTSQENRRYEPIDDIDALRCGPNFSVILYPYGIINFGSQRWDDELQVNSKTPPAFLVVASDDDFCTNNALAYCRALLRRKIPVEFHLYTQGGHSFAFHAKSPTTAAWPKRCEEWLRGSVLLKEE